MTFKTAAELAVKNVKITIIQSTFKIGLKRAGWNICAGGIFFLKINKRADQNIRAGGIFFSKSINVQTQKDRAGGNCSSKLINVHALLFGTLEYRDVT